MYISFNRPGLVKQPALPIMQRILAAHVVLEQAIADGDHVARLLKESKGNLLHNDWHSGRSRRAFQDEFQADEDTRCNEINRRRYDHELNRALLATAIENIAAAAANLKRATETTQIDIASIPARAVLCDSLCLVKHNILACLQVECPRAKTKVQELIALLEASPGMPPLLKEGLGGHQKEYRNAGNSVDALYSLQNAWIHSPQQVEARRIELGLLEPIRPYGLCAEQEVLVHPELDRYASVGIATCPYCALVKDIGTPSASLLNNRSVWCLSCGRISAEPLPFGAQGVFRCGKLYRTVIGTLLSVSTGEEWCGELREPPCRFEKWGGQNHRYSLVRHTPDYNEHLLVELFGGIDVVPGAKPPERQSCGYPSGDPECMLSHLGFSKMPDFNPFKGGQMERIDQSNGTRMVVTWKRMRKPVE